MPSAYHCFDDIPRTVLMFYEPMALLLNIWCLFYASRLVILLIFARTIMQDCTDFGYHLHVLRRFPDHLRGGAWVQLGVCGTFVPWPGRRYHSWDLDPALLE